MSEQSKRVKANILNSAFIKNPVLFEAVGLSPVLAMTVSLKSAIILTTASCIELLFIELFSCLALKKVKRWLRMPIYAILGILLNLPILAFFYHFTPNEALYAGIFLPLLAVNSLVALHCERFAVKHSLKHTAIDAVFASLGYAFVILLLGAVREILGSGTIYSVDLHLPIKLSGMLLPFGGFLLLGFFAAAVKAILQKKMPNAHPERAFRMQEISESHLGSLKSLLDTDFNPYADEEDEVETEKRTPKARKEKDDSHTKPSKKEKPKKPAKSRKAKSHKHEKKEKTPAPQKPLTPEELQKQEERAAKRAQRDGYLLDFDEMLSDLEAYQQKKDGEAVAKTPTSPEPLVVDTTKQPSNTSTATEESEQKGGDAT